METSKATRYGALQQSKGLGVEAGGPSCLMGPGQLGASGICRGGDGVTCDPWAQDRPGKGDL